MNMPGLRTFSPAFLHKAAQQLSRRLACPGIRVWARTRNAGRMEGAISSAASLPGFLPSQSADF